MAAAYFLVAYVVLVVYVVHHDLQITFRNKSTVLMILDGSVIFFFFMTFLSKLNELHLGGRGFRRKSALQSVCDILSILLLDYVDRACHGVRI